ncbi:MAG: cupin 2 protein [Gemmataceae bacterium]|nr:cupin 2 protein [Gemmataceae bacterium]
MSHPTKSGGDQDRPVHPGVRVIRPLELVSHAIAAAGVSRLPAITHELVGADKLWIGMTVLEPGTGTGPHHHGDHETGIYLVAGRIRLRWGMRLEVEAELEVGDLVFVPPHLPHEEINPAADEPAVWVVVWNDRQVFVPLDPDAAGVYGPNPADG